MDRVQVWGETPGWGLPQIHFPIQQLHFLADPHPLHLVPVAHGVHPGILMACHFTFACVDQGSRADSCKNTLPYHFALHAAHNGFITHLSLLYSKS
jgi:hypothetical protein